MRDQKRLPEWSTLSGMSVSVPAGTEAHLH